MFTTLAGSRRLTACRLLGHKGKARGTPIDLESEETIEETMSFMFEKLEVYQRAVDLAEKIDGLTETFATRGNYRLVDQLRRASLSISLNIAEGNGRWHANDRKNFFRIARGSAFECVPVLELCKRKKLITQESYVALKAELEILSKMLSALIKGTDKRE